MRRLAAILVAALALPAAAHAGVGSSLTVNTNFLTSFLTYYNNYYGPSAVAVPFLYPSVDIRLDELVIQIHAIEMLGVLASGNGVYVGGNVFVTPLTAPVSGSWEAFAGIGGSVDLASVGSTTVGAIGPVFPIGLRTGDDARFALYAEPGVLVAFGGGQATLVGEGSLVASVWF